MKTAHFFSIVAGFICLASCSNINRVDVKNPINISSPSPAEQLTKVSLNDTQKGYVEAGNRMSFRFLKGIYDGENMICSPLSLQYALAMTANGASGGTLEEIISSRRETLQAYGRESRVIAEEKFPIERFNREYIGLIEDLSKAEL